MPFSESLTPVHARAQSRAAATPKRPATQQDKLEKLEELRARGNLSPAEWDSARRRILDGGAASPTSPPPRAQRSPVARGGELAGLLGADLQRLMGIHRDQAAAAAAGNPRGAVHRGERLAVVTPSGGATRGRMLGREMTL